MGDHLNGLVLDLDESEYHRHSALSSTGARRILDSPARFRYTQQNPQPSTATFDLGKAVHARVLGAGAQIVELDYPDWRTKEAREARDTARDAGLVPMLAKDLGPINGMTEAVLTHPTARRLFEQDGHAEASLFADVDGVRCRARYDYFAPIGVDLKTTSGRADKHGFAQAAAKYEYEVQEAHYDDVREAVTGDRGQGFVFVVVENEPPYLVGIHQLDREFRDIGRAKARRARDTYRQCTETGHFPGYPEQIQLVMPPVWAVNDAIDKGLT